MRTFIPHAGQDQLFWLQRYGQACHIDYTRGFKLFLLVGIPAKELDHLDATAIATAKNPFIGRCNTCMREI